MASNNTLVGTFAMGEGWHNYHPAFPWDYKNSELRDRHLNNNAALIDFFAKIGKKKNLLLRPHWRFKNMIFYVQAGRMT